MNNLNPFAIAGFLACAALVGVFLLGASIGSKFAPNDCNRYGFFTDMGTVYDCKARP